MAATISSCARTQLLRVTSCYAMLCRCRSSIVEERKGGLGSGRFGSGIGERTLKVDLRAVERRDGRLGERAGHRARQQRGHDLILVGHLRAHTPHAHSTCASAY